MIKKKSLKKLLDLPNVNGAFEGDMKRKGKDRGKGIVVTVTKKLPRSQLKSKDAVPREIDGQKVDVIEIGELKALDVTGPSTVAPMGADRKAKYRPIPMGVSIGHKDITCGTAGWIVYKGGKAKVLSNNHVLADVNEGVPGDTVVQQGIHDGGAVSTHRVGVLEEFVPIKFGGTDDGCPISSAIIKGLNLITKGLGSSTKFGYVKRSPDNLVDCAIMDPDEGIELSSKVVELGDCLDGSLQIVGLLFAGSDTVTIANHINNVEQALNIDIPNKGSVTTGDTVWKSGRTTSTKESNNVVSTNYTASVNMGTKGVAVFPNQILINTPGFSAGGDSGSAIVKKINTNMVKK